MIVVERVAVVIIYRVVVVVAAVVVIEDLVVVGLFVCLFVVLRHTQEYFTHMETSPYAGEGLQICAYVRHLRLVSHESSLTCQNPLPHGRVRFELTTPRSRVERATD